MDSTLAANPPAPIPAARFHDQRPRPRYVLTTTISNHSRQSQLGRRPRGPGSLLNITKIVSPLEITWRPSSAWTTVLMTHESNTNHKSAKPPCAPSLVVMINSPEPTIEPTRISPGPKCRSVIRMPCGGSRNVCASRAYRSTGSFVSCCLRDDGLAFMTDSVDGTSRPFFAG